MKTLFLTFMIAVLAIGFLIATSPGKAEAWQRGPAFSFSVVVPPVGVSIGTPFPYDYYYYPAPVYVTPPYPVYKRPYYYGPHYGPYYRYRYWDRPREHRHWRY